MLTIESDEAVALASELAELTGKEIHDAVTEALRSRVEEERRIQAKVAKVLALAAEIRARLPHPLPTSDMSDFYDENGLPV